MRAEVILVILVVFVLCVPAQHSFGHGTGYETLAPQKIGDKTVEIDVTSNVDNATNAKQVSFSLINTDTRDSIRDVSYHIKAIKNNSVIFEGDYKAGNGILRLELIPTDDDSVKSEEKHGDGPFGALFGAEDGIVEASGNIFHKGGLYRFEIYIVSTEGYSGKSETPVRFDAGISFLESAAITTDTDSGKQQIRVLSYYDTPENVAYLKETKTLSFSMPFDWSDSGINQTSVVHQEVFIPKSFAGILATKYELYVNKIQLPDTAVIIDDYTNSDSRIVHIVINNSVLRNLKSGGDSMQFSLKPSHEGGFPITRYTSNAQYKVNLSWDPPTILSGSDVRLYFTIQDAYLITNKTISTSYDLVVTQGSHTLFKTSGVTGTQQNAKNMIVIPITKDQTGSITIKFENIGGNDLADAEFFTAIEKQAVENPTFPLKLTSIMPNSNEGTYNVDLTWFPAPLSTNEPAEFVLTVKDKSGNPIPRSSFDFVILQKGNEIFRQAVAAPAGGTYIDYTFAKEQEGPIILRIENINHSKETAELTIIVTPEFPLGVSMLMLGIGFIVTLAQFKKYKSITGFT